jgi:hypothetical protein
VARSAAGHDNEFAMNDKPLSGRIALVTGASEHRAGERSEAVARATINN